MIVDSQLFEICFPREASWVGFDAHREGLESQRNVTFADVKRHHALTWRVHKMVLSQIGLR